MSDLDCDEQDCSQYIYDKCQQCRGEYCNDHVSNYGPCYNRGGRQEVTPGVSPVKPNTDEDDDQGVEEKVPSETIMSLFTIVETCKDKDRKAVCNFCKAVKVRHLFHIIRGLKMCNG